MPACPVHRGARIGFSRTVIRVLLTSAKSGLLGSCLDGPDLTLQLLSRALPVERNRNSTPVPMTSTQSDMHLGSCLGEWVSSGVILARRPPDALLKYQSKPSQPDVPIPSVQRHIAELNVNRGDVKSAPSLLP